LSAQSLNLFASADDDLVSFASAITESFHANLYNVSSERRSFFEDPVCAHQSPIKLSVSNLNALSSKSPHFSPRNWELEKLSAEHSSQLETTSTNSSTETPGATQSTLRSLLLEPDMEDITTLWPRTLDLLDIDYAEEDEIPT